MWDVLFWSLSERGQWCWQFGIAAAAAHEL